MNKIDEIVLVVDKYRPCLKDFLIYEWKKIKDKNKIEMMSINSW